MPKALIIVALVVIAYLGMTVVLIQRQVDSKPTVSPAPVDGPLICERGLYFRKIGGLYAPATDPFGNRHCIMT